MAYQQFLEFRCDRCGRAQQYESIQSFQADRWTTIDYRPGGSSTDHPDQTRRDLCPKCADQFLHFLSLPLAEGARAEAVAL